jgi:RNA 2',3'-cyclic 3'-phosphodiesterase
VRLFLAVFPPAAVQRAAHQCIEALRRPGDGVSWVKPDNLHYTLRFLGEVGEDGAGRAAEAAAEAAGGAKAFAAALGGLGAFPNARRARVLWAGMSEGGAALEALARELDRALAKRGFGKADKPFSAHLTLGRVREPGPDWTAALAAQRVAADARFTVDRVCVVESRLDPRGSIYTVRAEGRLAP